MFTNLIESNSHKREFKRTSSFFIATVVAYALVLTAAGIVGILTYDAQVEAQNADLLLQSWIPPVKPAEATVRPDRPRASRTPVRPNAPVDQHIDTPVRTAQVPPVDDPRIMPPDIGVVASTIPPSEGQVRIGDHNADPPASPGDKNGCATCTGEGSGPVVTPQPTPDPTPARPAGPLHLTSIVLSGKAVNLPKPMYPTFAKQIRAQGPVNVQILVDENGSVISAHAVTGNPALTNAAEDAAKRARFSPTMLNGQPVKVQGVIVYNFVLQ